MGLTDALLEGVVSFVVQNLGDFAVGRVQQFSEISHDVDWIKKELLMMKASLRDADGRAETCEAFDEWEKQVKGAAFMIEDFMAEYVCEERGLTTGGSSSSNTALRDFNSRMVQKIQDIRNEVTEISRRGQAYILHLNKVHGFAHYSPDAWDTGGRLSQHVLSQSPLHEEMDVVGIEADIKKLMDWLLSEKETQQHLIMSIVGMGGSGKTTLAKRLYSLAHNQFDYHLWITVSQYSPSDPRAFLKEIKYNFNSTNKRRRNALGGINVDERSSAQGQQSLIDLLYGKRYVLFLDDIKDICFWSAIRDQLPRNGRGKIIFTSRQNITERLVDDDCHIHTISPLTYDLAWELFCKKAFRNYIPAGKCPLYLNKWCDAIVRRCSGLPLAIVLVGGFLCNKGNSERKWKEMVDHFGQELLHNPSLESLARLLQASYDDLPSHLKFCFLYACLFPQQCKIKRNALIRLWVAERFVKKQEGRTLEEVANGYFIQLTERCLLQPILSDFTGELVGCTVHSIMRDFATEKFPEEFGTINEEPCNGCEQKRYLAIHNSGFRIPCKKPHNKARTFLSFTSNACFCCETPPTLLSSRFLRVLCLDGLQIDFLPEAVGDLFHLVYLGLRKSGIQELPISLKKLCKLETLDIRDTRIITAFRIKPGSFPKLTHLLLQNMKVYSNCKLVEMPVPMADLTLLQTLLGIEVSTNSVGELHHLTQLQKLYIRMVGKENWRELFVSIGQIDTLCSLKLESCNKNGQLMEILFDNELPLPLYLEKLVLRGVIMELPRWFGLLRSLRVLVLVNSFLISDPLCDLAVLPNLVSLKLIHAYIGEQMGCGPEGFPRLRRLHIASIDFEEWTKIDEGTMPCIQILSIIDCCKLKMLPEGFENLRTLQTLEVIEMPYEFIERLRTDDKSKIEFIPIVTLLQDDCTTGSSRGVYRCLVGGLRCETDNYSLLRRAFNRFGQIYGCMIISDCETGRSTGFGLVTFNNQQSMKDAIEQMDGRELNGRRITVEKAQNNVEYYTGGFFNKSRGR